MNLLFLDIDGVLNDHRKWANHYSPILEANARNLNLIIAKAPDLSIAFSSAWRYPFDTVKAAEAVLCCNGVMAVGRIVEPTESDAWAYGEPLPDLKSKPKEWWDREGLIWRKKQIEHAVVARQPERFVVLDDLPLDVPNLVQTAPNVGLTERDAWKAIEILRGGE